MKMKLAVLLLLCATAFADSVPLDPGVVYQQGGNVAITLDPSLNPIVNPTVRDGSGDYLVFGFPVFSTSNGSWLSTLQVGENIYTLSGFIDTSQNTGNQMLLFGFLLPANYHLQQAYIQFEFDGMFSQVYECQPVTPVPEIPTGIMGIVGAAAIGLKRWRR